MGRRERVTGGLTRNISQYKSDKLYSLSFAIEVNRVKLSGS